MVLGLAICRGFARPSGNVFSGQATLHTGRRGLRFKLPLLQNLFFTSAPEPIPQGFTPACFTLHPLNTQYTQPVMINDKTHTIPRSPRVSLCPASAKRH